MNEMRTPTERTPPSPGRPRPVTAEQETLPFDQLPPVALPYDPEVDRPISFSLTARARRVVAPGDLPALRVIDDGALEQPNDTRPARARALHRAGVSVPDIGRQLHVDDLVAQAWVDGLHPTAASERQVHGRRGRRGLQPVPTAAGAGPTPHPAPMRPAASPSGADEAQRAAIHEASWRLSDDPDFAVGVGLLAALAEIDQHSVTMSSDRAELLGTATSWLTRHAGLAPDAVRVVLRLAPEVAADLERHRWATHLGVPLERVSYTRGGSAPSATVALVRVHDAELAGRVAGWRAALLDPPDTPADIAF